MIFAAMQRCCVLREMVADRLPVYDRPELAPDV
jgi:hypothetical protein